MILNLIDEPLRMLQAHADRDALRLDRDACLIQITINITGGMTRRQDHRSHESLSPIRLHADRLAIMDQQAIHPSLEMYLSATALNPLTHRLDHTRQLIRSDVRVRVDQDRRTGSMLTEDIQDPVHRTTFLAPCIKLSIGIGTGAAFAKTVIRLAIHPMLAADQGDIPFAGTHILSPLQHDRPQPQLDQSQGGEQAARPRAHHDYRLAASDRLIVDRLILRLGRQLIDESPQFHVHINHSLTSVDRTFQDPDRFHRGKRSRCLTSDHPCQRLLVSRLFRQQSQLQFFYHIRKCLKKK